MTTDNDTVHYKYISSRLTREIVEQHEAARPRWRRTASFRVGFASLGLEGLAPDYRNRYDLARRATNAVKDNTGNFNSPGSYLRATMNMELSKVGVHIGFVGTARQEVAGFFADEEVEDVGRVFVFLMGSVTNLTGWRAADKLQIDSPRTLRACTRSWRPPLNLMTPRSKLTI
ncbi:MAG: hypothetical protein WAV54_01385 [Acidimicrobiales bacterium]